MSLVPPPRLTYLPIASATQAKIRLYWLCRFHFSLSPNIIREICLFLSHSVCILHESKGYCYLYHIPSQKQIIVPIPEYYRDFGETSAWRAVCIGDYQVVACGGIRDSYPCVQTYLVNAGNLCRLEDMKKHRAFHAMLYYDFTHTMYVFGGAEGPNSKLAACEKFHIVTMKWTAVADMTTAKSHICACQHLTSVYILGDSAGRIETFSLVTEAFRELPKVVSPLDVLFVGVVRDELVVVTENSLQKVRLADWKITCMWRRDYRQCSAGLQHTSLYILHSDSVSLFHCLSDDMPQSLPFES